MNERKVFCSKVLLTSRYNLDELLLDGVFSSAIPLTSEKTVEASHIEDHPNFVTGIFVSTQNKGIPPAHTPGNEEDYNAIPLEEGQGLAYPNMFLYCKRTATLLWEYNRSGILESGMSRFFSLSAVRNGYPEIQFSLTPLMNLDAYDRISSLIKATEVEIQIAAPTAVLRSENQNNSIEKIARVANDFGASHSIKLVVKSTKVGRGLNIRSILDAVNFMDNNHTDVETNVSDKIKVVGLKMREDEQTPLEETINFTTDRLTGFFSLNQPIVASNLQVEERRTGIIEVYGQKYEDITRLVGSRSSR